MEASSFGLCQTSRVFKVQPHFVAQIPGKRPLIWPIMADDGVVFYAWNLHVEVTKNILSHSQLCYKLKKKQKILWSDSPELESKERRSLKLVMLSGTNVQKQFKLTQFLFCKRRARLHNDIALHNVSSFEPLIGR